METKNLKLTFCAGTGSVTGANFLLETITEPKPQKILVDCGLTQGTKMAEEVNWQKFQYDPASIDILFITHAHVDHIGRIPKLLADGFKGIIYSTPPTKDLAELMLLDTVNILGRSPDFDLAKIYTEDSAKKIMSLWKTIDYHEKLTVDALTFSYKDAGHILGSGMLEVLYNGKKIVFTGDLGNSPSPLLCDTEVVNDAEYLVMESVYGDRNHESRDERKKMLEAIIEDNYKAKGTLIIPTFSLERTQELLFEIDSLVENKRVPEMPIFLDSPLAIKLTAVYKKFQKYFNENAQKVIATGDDIFNFPGLHVTLKTDESKAIVEAPDPKIIIAGSGMSNGGRVVHHEKHYLPNPNNTLLLTGYQAVGTMGRQIEEGATHVHIAGEEVAVHARIANIKGYSGHKDSDHLVDFVEKMEDKVKKIFVVMGEPKSSLFLVQKIRDNFALDAIAPEVNDSVELPF